MSQLTALVLSITVEALVIFIAFRRAVKPALKLAAIAMAPTMITHPILWTLMRSLSSSFPYFWTVSIGEIIVVFVEAIVLSILSRTGFPYALFISFVANATSVLAGIVVWRFQE